MGAFIGRTLSIFLAIVMALIFVPACIYFGGLALLGSMAQDSITNPVPITAPRR